MTQQQYELLVQVFTDLDGTSPQMVLSEDGRVFMQWDKDDHHLEIEMPADKQAEVFYQNRRTGDFWGT